MRLPNQASPPQLDEAVVTAQYNKYATILCEELLLDNGYTLLSRASNRQSPLDKCIGPRQAMGKILQHDTHKNILSTLKRKRYGELIENARDIADFFDQAIIKHICYSYPDLDRRARSHDY